MVRIWKIAFILIVVFGLVALLCVMGDESVPSDSNERKENLEDPYSLWKQQPNHKIIFTSKADSEESELYLLENTGEVTRLTNNNRYEANPALSAGGKKVAFHGGDMDDPTSWEIYTLNLETGRETRLTNNDILDGHPGWSPNGSKIIFTSFRDAQGNPSGTSDIYVMNTNGTETNRLTKSEWDDADAEWAPDGSKIVFKSTRNTHQRYRSEIYMMDNDGSNVERLTNTSDNESDHDPSWSPDSETILFNRYEGSRLWIEITDLQTLQNHWQELTPWNSYKTDLCGNVTKLTNYQYIAGIPVFSEDGTKILFVKQEFIINDKDQLVGSYHRLFLMNPDGSDQEQLIPEDRHTPTLEFPDW